MSKNVENGSPIGPPRLSGYNLPKYMSFALLKILWKNDAPWVSGAIGEEKTSILGVKKIKSSTWKFFEVEIAFSKGFLSKREYRPHHVNIDIWQDVHVYLKIEDISCSKKRQNHRQVEGKPLLSAYFNFIFFQVDIFFDQEHFRNFNTGSVDPRSLRKS